VCADTIRAHLQHLRQQPRQDLLDERRVRRDVRGLVGHELQEGRAERVAFRLGVGAPAGLDCVLDDVEREVPHLDRVLRRRGLEQVEGVLHAVVALFEPFTELGGV
jgi:hypothetical protein